MPNPANKPTIAVDIDEVLALSAYQFIEWTNKRWGTNLTVDDYDEHWSRVWKLDNEEEAERMATKYLSHINSRGDTKSNPGAQEVLVKLSRNYKLVIATSRRLKYNQDTQKWLNEHFKDIFSEIHYAGIWDEVSDHRIHATKSDLLKQIAADYLIDDQPKHCIAAAKAGVKAILFGDYSWNRDVELTSNMVRAKNWQEVLEYFNAQ